MRTLAGILGLALIIIFNAFAAPGEKKGLDSEGFIQKWLVLAPIPIADGDSGSDALAKQQVKEEARFKPKAGDKVKVGGKELVWKSHTSTDHQLDFNAFLGGQTEDSVGYA